MADVSKAQKLASARKKFKELKKEKKKTSTQKTSENVESSPASREQTPVDITVITPTEYIQQEAYVNLTNYFNDNLNYNEFQQPAAFFDNYDQNVQPVVYNNEKNRVFSESKTDYQNNESLPNVNDENQETTSNVTTETQASEIVASINEGNYGDDEKKSIEDFATISFDSSEKPQLSSVESLRQMTSQMAELMNPNTIYLSSVESELELRNQELAANFDQEKLKNTQLQTSLLEYQARLAQAEAELRDRDLNGNNKIDNELSNLREELQCHVQTVGILVAEKAELVANLSQFQMVAKQKTADCEELQGRLKTSRSRVADLERELALLKNEKLQSENLGKNQNVEFDQLRTDYQRLKEEKDELVQDLLEVREKLKNSSESNLIFQQQIADLSNQVSMANLKIQQLTVRTDSEAVSGQVEELTREKFALEKLVSDLTQTVKTLTKEKDESNIQYQQYAQQLNAQLSNLANRLEQLQKENEALNIQEQNRVKHIGELEKQLQSIQSNQINFAVQRSSNETKVELDAALNLIDRLKAENVDYQEDYAKILQEKELLMKELELKEENIGELGGIIEELRGNQPDNAKLLAIMESDKVAASRAVSQNTEMKKQMESMEEVFDKLNNDKIKLIDSLTTEQRNSKELFEKLQKTELHLQTLADAIEIKDKELIHLRERSLQLNKQVLNDEQLSDRLRHYEAQDHSSHSLQNELQEANQTIFNLSEEINRLKKEKQNEMIQTSTEEVPDDPSIEKSVDPVTDNNHNNSWNTLDKASAMKHLEEKFLKTMEEVANLTEEKQRLEHLVLQLQSETETIGEYVALYQHQRSQLKQKTIEKDQQLNQLANDREHMKTKLEKLNNLVKRLVTEKGALPSELLHNSHETDDLCEEHTKINKEIHKITQINLDYTKNGNDAHASETAGEIIALLSEIKSSNLVQPSENLHHCRWCWGDLITV